MCTSWDREVCDLTWCSTGSQILLVKAWSEFLQNYCIFPWKAYLQGVMDKRAADNSCDVRLLPVKKQGRQVLVGESLDVMVQHYLMRVCQGAGVVSAWIVMAVARGILLSCNQSKLAEFEGDVGLRPSQMHEVCLTLSTHSKKEALNWRFCMTEGAVSGWSCNNSQDGKYPTWNDSELGSDWDYDCASSTWTVDAQGLKRVEVAGVGDKWLITTVFVGSLVEDFLPFQVIYQGKTDCCHPNY